MKPRDPSRADRRFERQFQSLSRAFPWASRPLRTMRNPMLWLVRFPIAILLIAGGFLAILPFFGLWMIPVGLLLLAVDIPRLKGPISAALIRGRRRLNALRRRLFH